jgi:hypothetical protein
VRAVSFNDADQKIEKNLSLSGIKRPQYAIVRGFGFDAQSSPESSSLPCEIEIACPPVGIINLPLDKTLRMKPINNKTRIARIDPHRVSEAALVNSRLKLQRNERAELQLYEVFPIQGFRNPACANLLKAPS